MISFTGGVEAGERIAGQAPASRRSGWSSAQLAGHRVEATRDWTGRSSRACPGRSGQPGRTASACSGSTSHEDIYDAFRDQFVARTTKYKIGNKLDEATDMGPMITEGEAERVERLGRGGGCARARPCCRRRPRGHAGGADRARERAAGCHARTARRCSGPRSTCTRSTTSTRRSRWPTVRQYGLHAAVFTKDVDMAFKVASGLDCGGVMINDSTDYRLDSMPFGGVKKSGLGREGIKFSLQEMTEPKVVLLVPAQELGHHGRRADTDGVAWRVGPGHHGQGPSHAVQDHSERERPD